MYELGELVGTLLVSAIAFYLVKRFLFRDGSKIKKGIGISVLVLISLVTFYNIYVIATKARPIETVENSNEVEQIVEAAPSDVFRKVNEKRIEKNISPLAIDDRLMESASYKANDMSERSYFSHNDPTGVPNGINKALEITGITCATVSENLYKGDGSYSTSDKAIETWLDSQSHKDAMLNEKYALTGIGISKDKAGYVYVVQHFCELTK